MNDGGELVGKRVTFVFFSGKVAVAVVTGLDRDIGVSIQEEGTGEYLLCINGPMSPLWGGEIPVENHYWVYDNIERAIHDGVVRSKDIRRWVAEAGASTVGGVSAEHCAFAQ